MKQFCQESEATPPSSSVKSTPASAASHRRGPKRRLFEDLSERTKSERSRLLTKTEPLEKLLRSAEKAARRSSLPNTVKILHSLIVGREAAASKLLKASHHSEMASIDDSLLLKTRLALSKRKYQKVEKFTKQVYGTKLLQPWAKVIM